MKSIKAFVEMFDSCRDTLVSAFPYRNPVFVLRILNCISENTNISQDELSRLTGISKGEVSKIVGKLTEKGWVRSEAVKSREGSRPVYLTPGGHEVLAALDQDFDKKINLSASSKSDTPSSGTKVAKVRPVARRRFGRPSQKDLENTGLLIDNF